jgi:hypothetical protein
MIDPDEARYHLKQLILFLVITLVMAGATIYLLAIGVR